ncbi:MAG: prepilin peptidase [bacterium]
MMIWFFYICAIFVAFCIGSFLNVVILRGPVAWRLINATQHYATPPTPEMSLSTPRSFCPSCGTQIKFWHLVPLISYLALSGKSACCQKPIAIRYFLTELATGLVAILLLWQFGLTFLTLASFVFFCFLFALAQIDLDTGYLPDMLTLPFIAIGLMVNVTHIHTSFTNALIGAAIGYLAFWAINSIYRQLRNRDGLGMGDAKLLAGCGAWFGWFPLPFIVLIAALAGLSLYLAKRLLGQQINADSELAFGPFLAFGAFTILLVILLQPNLFP